MKQKMAPDIPLATVIIAGSDRGRAPGPGQTPAVTAGMTDIAGHRMVNPPGNPGGGPDSFIGQMDYVFHELHADGRHALCGVCGNQ